MDEDDFDANIKAVLTALRDGSQVKNFVHDEQLPFVLLRKLMPLVDEPIDLDEAVLRNDDYIKATAHLDESHCLVTAEQLRALLETHSSTVTIREACSKQDSLPDDHAIKNRRVLQRESERYLTNTIASGLFCIQAPKVTLGIVKALLPRWTLTLTECPGNSVGIIYSWLVLCPGRCSRTALRCAEKL